MDSTYLVTNYEGSGQTAEFPKHVQNGSGNYRPIHLVDSKIPMWQKDSYGILNNKCHKEIISTLHAFHEYYDAREILLSSQHLSRRLMHRTSITSSFQHAHRFL